MTQDRDDFAPPLGAGDVDVTLWGVRRWLGKLEVIAMTSKCEAIALELRRVFEYLASNERELRAAFEAEQQRR